MKNNFLSEEQEKNFNEGVHFLRNIFDSSIRNMSSLIEKEDLEHASKILNLLKEKKVKKTKLLAVKSNDKSKAIINEKLECGNNSSKVSNLIIKHENKSANKKTFNDLYLGELTKIIFGKKCLSEVMYQLFSCSKFSIKHILYYLDIKEILELRLISKSFDAHTIFHLMNRIIQEEKKLIHNLVGKKLFSNPLMIYHLKV